MHPNTTTTTSPSSPISQYLLLFRGDDWDQGLSREETQRAMDRVGAWFESLEARGLVKAGQPLAREGTVLTAKGERPLADGPYAESKEVVGGYLLVETGSFEEAVEIARGCPMRARGIEIEVRPVLDECPISQRLRESAPATAAVTANPEAELASV